MPDCEYCSRSFDDEDAYLRHLRSDHESELGAIDQRRVATLESDEGGLPTGPLVLGLILLASVAVVGYVVLFASGSDAASEPHSHGSVHKHGTMAVTIAGEQLDLTSDRYAHSDRGFHFHDGQQNPLWHIHAQDVTLQYALATLGIEVNDAGTVLRHDGNTYRDDDPNTEVIIEVDGESVEPASYTIEGVRSEEPDAGGDHVRVVVRVDDG